ncbi:MAG: carboxymuconolactone decarboxylase family protein [Chloroflexi bacterium]|nr:carboxymuconolactone decarboxylase family protein [Chloroflexota bacterium]
MSRLPEAQREDFPEELRAAFDAVHANGKPIGPGSVTIHSPELARLRLPVSGYVRWNMDVDAQYTELAILVAARALDCAYVWNAHAVVAAEAGVSQLLIDALRDDQPLPTEPTAQAALTNFGLELIRSHKVSDATYQAALDAFGTKALVELTSLMGHYAQNAMLVAAFDVTLPEKLNAPILPV